MLILRRPRSTGTSRGDRARPGRRTVNLFLCIPSPCPESPESTITGSFSEATNAHVAKLLGIACEHVRRRMRHRKRISAVMVTSLPNQSLRQDRRISGTRARGGWRFKESVGHVATRQCWPWPAQRSPPPHPLHSALPGSAFFQSIYSGWNVADAAKIGGGHWIRWHRLNVPQGWPHRAFPSGPEELPSSGGNDPKGGARKVPDWSPTDIWLRRQSEHAREILVRTHRASLGIHRLSLGRLSARPDDSIPSSSKRHVGRSANLPR